MAVNSVNIVYQVNIVYIYKRGVSLYRMGVVSCGQRVSKECLEKMDKMKLFDGRKSSFNKAVETLITFCELNKKEFEKWKNNNKK